MKARAPTGGGEETARGPAAEDWSFWVKWYDDALAGLPPNWEMFEEIALIEPETWGKGPRVVNPLINDIRAKHLRKATFNAERIVENTQTGKLAVLATSDLPTHSLSDIQNKLLDLAEVFDGQGGANGPYGELMPEVELTRKAATLNNPSPIRLYDMCRRAALRAEARVACGECPKGDALVEDFIRQLEEATFDIMGSNAAVRDVATSRAQFRMLQAAPDTGGVLATAASDIAAHSEGELAEELPGDAQLALDPAQPDEVRKSALYVLASRIVRVYLGVRKTLSETHEISKDVAGISKNLAIALGAYPAIQAAMNYLLSLF